MGFRVPAVVRLEVLTGSAMPPAAPGLVEIARPRQRQLLVTLKPSAVRRQPPSGPVLRRGSELSIKVRRLLPRPAPPGPQPLRTPAAAGEAPEARLGPRRP